MLLATTVGGCKVEEKSDAKVSDMKFTVISETELPDELKKIIEEKKQKEMKLHICPVTNCTLSCGYGVQKTGGYSIQVKDLYQAKMQFISNRSCRTGRKGRVGKSRKLPIYSCLDRKNGRYCGF